MTQLQFKVKLDPITIKVEKEDYKDAWQEHQEEEGNLEEGEDAGEPPDDFILAQVIVELESGNRDLSEAFEDAAIEVTRA